MTVRELIQVLTTMPPELLVVSEGYENGFDSIKAVRFLKVENNENKNWWDGEFVESNIDNAVEVIYLNTERKAKK
jgi:hypothetical protein